MQDTQDMLNEGPVDERRYQLQDYPKRGEEGDGEGQPQKEAEERSRESVYEKPQIGQDQSYTGAVEKNQEGPGDLEGITGNSF